MTLLESRLNSTEANNVMFVALSAARQAVPGCPVCDISMKMAYRAESDFGDIIKNR